MMLVVTGLIRQKHSCPPRGCFSSRMPKVKTPRWSLPPIANRCYGSAETLNYRYGFAEIQNAERCGTSPPMCGGALC